MKILLINKFYFLKGGAEKHFFDLKKLLEDRGHQVVVFSMQHKNNLPSEYSQYFVSNVDFEKVKFNWQGLRVAGRMMYSFEAKRKLSKLIKKEKPDIAHIHNIYHQISPSILNALSRHNIPTVMTLHDFSLVSPDYNLFSHGQICERSKGGNYFSCVLNRCVKNSFAASFLSALELYWHGLLKIYEDNVDLFISPSRFLTKMLRDWEVPIVDLVHVPNFINLKDMYNKSAGEYILYVGRLSVEKGVENIIDAVKGLAIKAIIAGTGPQEDMLKNKVKNEKINNVEFTGHLDANQLEEFYQKAKFLVLPSICYENFPTVILEAYAYGLPVIGANHGGITELIKHEKNGLLFAPGSAVDLRQKILCMLKNPRLEKIYGQQAYETVKKYSPENYYKKILKYYEKLVAEKKEYAE